MKQFISIIIFSIITINSFADTTNVINRTIDNVETTVATIDTSSLYKQIYGDVKVAISGMADALKVGAEHVYMVLVKQQIVRSISNTVSSLFILILCTIFFIIAKQTYPKMTSKDSIYDLFFGLSIGLCVISFIILVMFFSMTISETVTGFVNPEYGAMKELVTWVK